MTTNAAIITDALREINVISEVGSASDEQGSQGLTKLNRMMDLWNEQSIEIGWFKQSSTTDTCPIPEWMEQAVVLGLAVRLAPQYGRSVSVELAHDFDNALSTVKRKLIAEGMDNADMSHMAYGTGRYNSRYDIETDI